MVAKTAAKRYLISLAAIVVGMIMRKKMYKFEDDSAIIEKEKHSSEGYGIDTSHTIDESFLMEKLQNSIISTADEDLHDHYYYVQDDDDVIFDIDTGEFIGDDDYVREKPDRQMELKLRGNWK